MILCGLVQKEYIMKNYLIKFSIKDKIYYLNLNCNEFDFTKGIAIPMLLTISSIFIIFQNLMAARNEKWYAIGVGLYLMRFMNFKISSNHPLSDTAPITIKVKIIAATQIIICLIYLIVFTYSALKLLPT